MFYNGQRHCDKEQDALHHHKTNRFRIIVWISLRTILLAVDTLVARAIHNAICANQFARIIRNWNPYFYSASGRFARITQISDSRKSPESIRANHATKVDTQTAIWLSVAKVLIAAVDAQACNFVGFVDIHHCLGFLCFADNCFSQGVCHQMFTQEQSQKFKVMSFWNFEWKMWWIFGGEFSVYFPQENRLKHCPWKLHRILHRTKENLVTWTSLWEHPRLTNVGSQHQLRIETRFSDCCAWCPWSPHWNPTCCKSFKNTGSQPQDNQIWPNQNCTWWETSSLHR